MTIYSQNFQWAYGTGDALDDAGRSVVVDYAGNVYTTGYFRGVVDFDASASTYTLSSPGSVNNVFISKTDALGNFMWAKQMGGSGNMYGMSIAVGSFGDVYITGYFTGTADFNPGGTSYTLTSAGQTDIFIAKVDGNGSFMWAKSIGNTGADRGQSIGVDMMDNVYTTGYFAGTTDFDTGLGVFNLTSSGGTFGANVFVSKLDYNGNFVWAKKMGGAGNALGYSINVDFFGNSYTTGSFIGTGDFDPNAGITNLISAGGSDVFVEKIDANGDFVWAKNMGGATNDVGYALTLDAYGYTYITGWFEGVSDFDPNAGVTNLTSAGLFDTFITKLDISGNFIWSKSMGGPDQDYVSDIVVDASQNVYTTGSFSGTASFDPNSNLHDLTSQNYDGYISKLDAMGNFIFVEQFGGINDDVPISMDLESSGNIYITGNYMATVDFDFSAGVMNQISSGLRDIFIMSLFDCSVPPVPVNITSPINQMVCGINSATLNVSGNGSIQWYASPTSTVSIDLGLTHVTGTLTPGTYTFYADATTCITSTSRAAITLTVSNACEDVWPGDANSDGLANNLDVLELGLHYTQTGVSRTIASNSWQLYHADNWVGTISNGMNLNHSDCNGDGTINDNDTLAIYNNYGLTHAFKTAETTTLNPQLNIVPNQPLVVKGTWGTSSIYLGETATPVNNINGIAFTINFDKTLIEPNSIWIEYPTSFINSNNDNLHFRKLDFTNGNIYTATTHTLNNNVNGNGLIGILHYQIKSSLMVDTILNISLAQASQSDVLGNVTSLTVGASTLMAIGASVNSQAIDSQAIVITLFPNPNNGDFTFSATETGTYIIVNSIAQTVQIIELKELNQNVNIKGLAQGIYYIFGKTSKAKIVVTK